MGKTISKPKTAAPKRARQRRVTEEMYNNFAAAIKVTNTQFHVMPRRGKWIVKINGGVRALGIFATQQEALSFAEEKQKMDISKHIVVHEKNGEVAKIIE